MQFRYLKVDGGEVAYLGSLSNHKALLFIGRSNPSKESIPLKTLINQLILDKYVVLWPIERTYAIVNFLNVKCERIARWLDDVFGTADSPLKAVLRRIAKASVLLCYPSKWDHFFLRKRRSELAYQIDFYRRAIRTVVGDKAFGVISHSAGGRIASHLCDEQYLAGVICFGYPFKHPDKPEEPERTENLKRIKTPFLIVQGTEDPYGGIDVVERYELSPSIELEFVVSGHNYENISDADWSRIINRIEAFLADR